MNLRRRLVAALSAGALAAPLELFAQQQAAKVYRIGFLGIASASGYVRELDWIRDGLRKLGYVEGRNIVIEYRWADGNPERLRAFAAEFVALKAQYERITRGRLRGVVSAGAQLVFVF